MSVAVLLLQQLDQVYWYRSSEDYLKWAREQYVSERATIERAGLLMRSLEGDASTLSRTLTVVKIAKPNQDMRFDVPVVGLKTIGVMHKAGASCLALDAGRCLLLDGAAIIDEADRVGVSIVTE